MVKAALIVMLAALIFGLALFIPVRAYGAEPVLVYRSAAVTVRLAHGPCAVPSVVAALPAAVHPDLKAATATWSGQVRQACWVKVNETQVVIADDAGMGGTIEVADLRPEE